MEYKWDPSLETGYMRVDNQHKDLIIALNEIIKASQHGKGSEEIINTVSFLADYTVMHFSTEEMLMEQFKYPDYPFHKSQHDQFKDIVGKLTKKLSREGPTEELIKYITTLIGKWLVHHIKDVDFKMAVFLKSKNDS